MKISKKKSPVIITTLILISSNLLLGKNLAPNPSFESKKASGRVTSYTGKLFHENRNAHSGKYCLKQTFRAGHSWNVIQMRPPFIKCKPNTWYRLSVWNKNTVPSGNVSLGIRQCYSAKQNTKSVGYLWKNVQDNINIWTKYSLEFKTSPKTNGLSIYFKIGIDVYNGEVFWDDVKLEQIPPKVFPLTFEPMPATFFKNSKNYFGIYPRKWMEVDLAAVKMKFKTGIKTTNGIVKAELFRRGKSYLHYSCASVKPKDYEMTLNFSSLEPGSYDLNVTLQDGAKTLQKEVRRVVILPKTDYAAVKLQPIKTSSVGSNRELLVNGKPFYPLYFSHLPSSAQGLNKARKQFGINLSSVWASSPKWQKKTPQEIAANYIRDFKRGLDRHEKAGVYGSVPLFSRGIYQPGKGINEQIMTQIVEALKDHPALLMFMLFDEPEGQKIPAVDVIRWYKMVKKLAPKRIVWTNFYRLNTFSEYVKGSDIASYCYYPFPADSVSAIYAWNQAIGKESNYRKPLLSYLQTYASGSTPMPTTRQLTAQFYVDIISGMKLFAYYAWYDPKPTQSMETDLRLQSAVKTLCWQSKKLKPFLDARTPPQPRLKLPRNFVFLYKVVADNHWLIMVNMNSSGVASPIAIAAPGAVSKRVKRMFENGLQIKVGTDGILRDLLKPLDVRIYRYKK